MEKNPALVPDKQTLILEAQKKVQHLTEAFRFILKFKRISSSGMEFFGLRKYAESDDASKIDWKTSVRLGSLYVKQYEEELDLGTFFIVDTSDTMLFGTKNMLKSTYAGIAVSTLAFAATEARTAVGMCIFNDKQFILPAEKGELQYYKIAGALSNPDHYYGSCRMADAINNAFASLDNRTLLIIVSDFINIEGNWISSIKQASTKFEAVIGIMIRDAMDCKIPKDIGTMRVKDISSSKITEVDASKIAEKYEKEVAMDEERIAAEFKNIGAGFIKVLTTEDYVPPLMDFFNLWASRRS